MINVSLDTCAHPRLAACIENVCSDGDWRSCTGFRRIAHSEGYRAFQRGAKKEAPEGWAMLEDGDWNWLDGYSEAASDEAQYKAESFRNWASSDD